MAAGPALVFRGPSLRRLTAEQFIDALLMFDLPAASCWRTQGPGLADEKRHLDEVAWPSGPQYHRHRPLQDFSVLRDPRMDERRTARALLQPASRALLRRGFDSPDALVAEVCLRLLGRGPTSSAAAKMKRVLGSAPDEAAIADLLWVVIMLPEFQFIL